MIKSALAKLTLYYLAIIMAISLSFSFLIYRISANELTRNFQRTPVFLNVSELKDAYSGFAHDRLTEAQARLQLGLLLFNLVVLVGGGAASYILARRTLIPIEEAFARQSRFTADASHELRTPLTAMQTEIEVALRNKSLSSKQAQELLKSTLEEVNKLKNLSNALLKLAQSDNQTIDLGRVPVQDIIDAAVANIKNFSQEKGISVKHRSTPLVAIGDSDMLTEAVSILLDNAVKYSPAKSEVTIQTTSESHNIIIQVHDQGPGILPVDMPHIFERFYRSDQSRTKDQAEGYGLGLSIAERIMALHGGKISVHSVPNKGTAFRLTIPRGNS